MPSCRACGTDHRNGYTHGTAVLYGAGIYPCEICAMAGYGAIAVGDGTVCRKCIGAMDANL